MNWLAQGDWIFLAAAVPRESRKSITNHTAPATTKQKAEEAALLNLTRFEP
jgi:hypothetical protein